MDINNPDHHLTPTFLAISPFVAGTICAFSQSAVSISSFEAGMFGVRTVALFQVFHLLTGTKNEWVKNQLDSLNPQTRKVAEKILVIAQFSLAVFASFGLGETPTGSYLPFDIVFELSYYSAASLLLVRLFAQVIHTYISKPKEIPTSETKLLELAPVAEPKVETEHSVVAPKVEDPVVEKTSEIASSKIEEKATEVKPKIETPSIAEEFYKSNQHLRSIKNLSQRMESNLIRADSKDMKGAFKELENLHLIDSYNTFTAGIDPINREKNRYGNVIPFDHNRVKIPKQNDYFNGSWVDVDKDKFIVTQGPLENTVEDFWSAIIHHQSYLIVALAKDFENGKPKCHPYWKISKPLSILGFTVNLVSDEVIENSTSGQSFVKRRFTLKKGDETREVTQLHYWGWPDHGIPDETLFSSFMDKYHELRGTVTGPTTVHCSAGVGRSCVFLEDIKLQKNMDAHKKLKKSTDTMPLDVIQDVVNFRKQRLGMLQTADQLFFVYLRALKIAGLRG